MSQKNVSDQIIDFLIEVGVKVIFGIPGDTIDSIMEALRVQNKIRFVLCRHEEASALAASAYAKLTGELAVCVACQGPGAIHLLNGLYDACADQAPVLAITGQVPNSVIGSHMPQEINQITLFSECTVYNQELRSASQVIPVFMSACQAALDNLGVAHISIPSDVARAPAVPAKVNTAILKARYQKVPDPALIDQAVKLLDSAKSVAILYGAGSRNASAEIVKLSEKLQASLTHTTRSKDIIDNHHENYMGGIGLMGARAGNHALHHCEVLLIVGSSFAFSEYYPEKAKIIQIEVDPARISKHTHVELPIVGDSKVAVSALLSKVKAKSDRSFIEASRKARSLNDKIEDWQNRSSKAGALIHPQALTHKIGEHLPKDAVICVDSGGVTVWTNNFLKLNGRQRYSWGANLASLGYALPATLGAQMAFPDRKVIGIAGDGGFGMLMGDFSTAVRYKLPILYIVYNNFCYGFIELEEQAEGNPIFGTKLHNPDFAEFAKVFGGDGVVVKNYDDLDQALKKGMASKVPFIIDVHTDPKELFIPPVINPKMVELYAKSQLRGWFAKPSKSDQ